MDYLKLLKFSDAKWILIFNVLKEMDNKESRGLNTYNI